MARGVQIKDKDRGYRKVLRNIERSRQGRRLSVGVKGDERIQKIASYHEFGLGVPERSFLRAWFDENGSRIKRDLKEVGIAVVRGDDEMRKAMLEDLGRQYVSEIQDKILRHINPDLTAETIKEKTKAGYVSPETPLFATGELLGSIVATLDGEILR